MVNRLPFKRYTAILSRNISLPPEREAARARIAGTVHGELRLIDAGDPEQAGCVSRFVGRRQYNV